MKQLVIWDEQREYALRLMRYLNQCANGLFVVLLVRNQDELIPILRQGSVVCLLVAEELRTEAQEVKKQLEQDRQEAEVYWMELTGQPVKETYQLYRYDSAQLLYEQLTHRVFKTTADGQSGSLQVIGIFALQDTVDVRRHAREEVQSNLEIFWEMTVCSDYEGEFYPAEQMLFAIKMRDEGLKDKLSEFLVCVDQTRMISALSQFFDGRQLTLEDYHWFFEQLSEAGYEKLYLYMDCSMLQDMKLLFSLNELRILSEGDCDNRRRHLLKLFEVMGISNERQVVISL